MTTHQPPRFNRALVLLATTLPYACVGTEADNPFAENPAQITPCKSHEEYEPFALSGLRDVEPVTLDSRLRLAVTPAPEDPAEGFSRAGEGLTPLSEFPFVTECTDWAVVGDELAFQFVGFVSGCGITWTGDARVVEAGVVSLELKSKDCSAAACGNCSYDVRGRVPLEAIADQSKLTLRLSLDTCDGKPERSEWVIDMGERAAGNRCRLPPREAWGGGSYATAYQIDLYEDCDSQETDFAPVGADGICAEALTCSAGRCVPACATSEECPLDGAFECVDGLCQLRK